MARTGVHLKGKPEKVRCAAACWFAGRNASTDPDVVKRFRPRHEAEILKCLSHKGLRPLLRVHRARSAAHNDLRRALAEKFRSNSFAARHCGASTCGDRSAPRVPHGEKIRGGLLTGIHTYG